MVTENNVQGDGNTCFLRAARAGNLERVLEHLKNNININTSNANGLNALHLASKDGHIHVVSELLRRGAVVDSATNKGNTALHIAALAGQEEVVKMLLEHGASVNVQSQNGFTPLYMAAQENHDSVVKLLLANGANQSLATEDGFTPLAVAMQQGHDKVVAVLLESDTRGKVRLPALHIAAKKDDVKAATLLLDNDHNPDVTSKSGFTPLHIASHYGNQAVANLLIQKGADVNYTAKHNINPLHVAAKWGKANMVSLLLEKGAIIEAKTRDGLTPLHCAARSGHEQVVDMLLERGAPISAKTKNGLAPLHMAAQGEHVDAARILLYHRAPVDEVTVDYLTALHVAAHCGHVRVAKLLLDRNADANARALNGFTPLHIACKKNRIKVVELLLRHGASISATTESGLTPLHVAAFMGCMNIVIYLLQHDASPDVPTVRGETPLHLAARANQTDIIRILLRNGAQVDARAREQQTPLHIASRLGNVDIVMLLLQHSAQVDATTKDMYTALHIAAKEGQDEVAAVLIENGAALDAATKKGFTPLHLAAKYGHSNVAELLLQKEAHVDAKGKNGVTPLHVACHYNNQNVALLLLENGASPHATAKNGHSTLHIVARKNQMDIATSLLEYGAQANAESKAGFTPLHLACQGGHTEMCNLFIEHKANVNHPAKNGLTPMHLCAQEDSVQCAEILHKNDANIDMVTKAGYTPLHVAAHFGQANMVRFLLQKMANVDAATSIGYTPLHQTAQQGHCHIVNLLLEHKANANAQTVNGQTPLHIARKLGYISVLDSLKSITNKDDESLTLSDEKYRVVAPEAMHESFMSDSEEEGGEDNLLSDQPYRYLTVDEMKSLGDDSLPIDVTRDERADSNRFTQNVEYGTQHLEQPSSLGADSICAQKVQVHGSGKDHYDSVYMDNSMHEKQQFAGFLVSFLVDARGGAMRGCRHSGVRMIIPARSTCQPTRVTCRYVKPQRTMHPPQLMEGEALASRVLELGPVSTQFIGPVIMEVPHFASLRGKEREIIILRSDNGESWREHIIENSDEILQNVLQQCFEPEEIAQMAEQAGNRVCRFVTYDFPQYFAIVSRIRQEVHAIGPEGGMVSSTVVPQVQAVFPQGALTKKIKVGLQAQPVDSDLTAKLLGRGVAVSPIVTVEPRRRKFHKAITLSMPAPKAHSQGMVNQYSSGNTPTLRLLCSITGGPSRAQWEDVTGSTPLTFVNDCVSFTTTVSARFWLMDCRNISDATRMATELYKEVIHVPFLAKFVVFAKRVDTNEARLRVFCMTDDREMKTLEKQELYTEVAKSRDVEVLEGKSQFVEMAGNLLPVTKSGEQLKLHFKAFRENRLPFTVRVKDQHADIVGRTLFMKEPKVAKGEPPQHPICILNILLPENIIPDSATTFSEKITANYSISLTRPSKHLNDYYIGDMRIVDVSNLLGGDWIQLAPEIGINVDEINRIVSQYPDSIARQAQHMIQLYRDKPNYSAPALETALQKINRGDIIRRCKTTCETDFSKSPDYNQKLNLAQQESKHIQHINEQNEIKYSAEEKDVEESESDEDTSKRTVAERREKIVKRLSIERQIPASTQKKEITREIIEIKRKSLIEDKKAIHESEIMMQLPADNIMKSTTTPDQILKIKSSNNGDTTEISKIMFELNNKLNKRNSEDYEDFSEDRTASETESSRIIKSSSHDDSEKLDEILIDTEKSLSQEYVAKFEESKTVQQPIDTQSEYKEENVWKQNQTIIQHTVENIEIEKSKEPEKTEKLPEYEFKEVTFQPAEKLISQVATQQEQQIGFVVESQAQVEVVETPKVIELISTVVDTKFEPLKDESAESTAIRQKVEEPSVKKIEKEQVETINTISSSPQHDIVVEVATQLLEDTEQSIERYFEKDYEHENKLTKDRKNLKSIEVSEKTTQKLDVSDSAAEYEAKAQSIEKDPSFEEPLAARDSIISSSVENQQDLLEDSEKTESDVPIEVFNQSTLPLAPVPKPRSQTVAILRSSDQDLKDDIERPIITDDEGKAPKLEKLISNDSTDITEESDLAETRFYIGESSKNVIIKTTPNKEDDENFEETAAKEQEQGAETVEDDEQLENKILRQNSETRNDILELEQEHAAEKKYQKELEQQLEKSEWEISEKKINQVHIEGKSINQEPMKSTAAFSTQIDSSIISKTEGFEYDQIDFEKEQKSGSLEDSKSTDMITKHVVHFTNDTPSDEHDRMKRSIQEEVSNLNTSLEKHDSYSAETEMKEQGIKQKILDEVSKIQEKSSFEKQDSYLAETLSKTEMKEQEIKKRIQDEVSKIQEASSLEKQDSYLAETLSKTEMKEQEIKKTIQDEVSKIQEESSFEKQDSYLAETLSKTEMKEQEIEKTIQDEVSKVQEKSSFEKQDSYLAETLSKTEMKEQEIKKTIQDEVSKIQEKSSFEKQDSYLAETLSKTEMKEQEIEKTIQDEVSNVQEKSSFEKQDSYLAGTLSKTEMKGEEIKKSIQEEVSEIQEKSSLEKQDLYLAGTLSKTEMKGEEIKKTIQDEVSQIQSASLLDYEESSSSSFAAENMTKIQLKEQELKRGIQDDISQTQPPSLLDFEESTSSESHYKSLEKQDFSATQLFNKNELEEQEMKRNIQDDVPTYQSPIQQSSLLDFEESTSSESPFKSLERHESLIYTQPNSSEYMTAMDGTSTFREGTEYISAMSTFDSTGRSTSSHDSMRSLDSQSEISGQLGTISVSEFTDTLVASSSEAEALEEGDDMNPELELSDDDNYVDDIDETTECDPNEISLQDEQAEKTLMKRSKEMIFKDIIEKQTEDATSPQLVAEDNTIIQSPSYETETKQADDSHTTFPISIQTNQPLGHYSMQEEGKIATSLEEASILSTSFSGSDLYEPRHSIDASLIACSLDDGSVLSASFSSTANVETVIENFESGADLPHTEEDCSNKLTEEIFNLESLQDTQTLLPTSMDEISKQQYAAEDSTEKGFESKLLPGFGEGKESESESDTDPYESEYVRQFRSPIERKTRRKKQAAAEIDYGLEFEKRPFTPSDLVADIIVEDEDTEKLEEQAAAQHELQKPQQTYANIPDITVTIETQQKDEATERERKLSIDKETELPEEKNLYKVKTQKELNKVTDDAFVHSTQKAAREEEKFQKLMEEQYKKKLAQIQDFDINDEQHKADSPDSFEVIEQPDISDEFVIVEEVAKEANEVDLGGQSIDIQAGKIESKHDEEVEKIIIKSAPADPKLGSQIYRDDMNFEFEESPPTTGSGSEVQEESDSNDLTSANKRWIEMQLADNQMRYPYDIAGGVLEDIKEEDAEFEVGSSRISSYKDSFSSTPEYDNMSSRRYATRGEHVDNVSMSSLQEFESLEQAISLENRNKMCHGSTDSSSGSFPRRYIARNTTQGDDISVSSLKEFEGLENACFTAHMVEIKAKEEAALLSRSDESDKSSHSDKEAKPTIDIEALTEKLPAVKESTVEVEAATVAQDKVSSSAEAKEPVSPRQRD